MNRRAEYHSIDPNINRQLQAHLAATATWGANVSAAHRVVKEFVATHLGLHVLGFTAQDRLGLQVSGIVISPPATSKLPDCLMPVPSDLCREFADRADLAFAPDVTTSLGRQLKSLLEAVSREHSARPLLSGVPGIQPLGLSEGRVVITAAHTDRSGKPFISAAPNAVTTSPTLQPRSPQGAARAALDTLPAGARRSGPGLH